METILKIVKVFIGSPGGLEEERLTARRIVDEINQSHSEHWGCQLKLVGWEATLSGYSRAQSLINQDLDKCEYFVGIIWNHWGSKPDDGDSRYTSGFEEEFERAKERFDLKAMKDISLFFREIPEVQLKDLGPSVTKVLEFRSKCIERRKPLFKEFKEARDFEAHFRAAMEQIGWQEALLRELKPEQSSEPEQPDAKQAEKPEEHYAPDGLIGAPAAQFVSELLRRTSDWDSTDAYEVARLRLIAASTNRSGNDEIYLGNHDANLLFARRHNIDVSDQEIRGLINAGVAGFTHQNVPLWYWLTKKGSMDGLLRLQYLAAIGSTQEKPNAIRLLQRMGNETPSLDQYFDKKQILRTWLSDESKTQTFDAGLEFLYTNGSEEDLAIVLECVDSVAPNLLGFVHATLLAMTCRIKPGEALTLLLQLDPDPIDQKTIDHIFHRPETIKTNFLEKCLGLKSDRARKSAAGALYSRNAIEMATAERLMTDSDPEIRLLAIQSLTRMGAPPDDSIIRKALVLNKPGLMSLGLGLGSRTDDSYYERYQYSNLYSLSQDELRDRANNAGIFDYLEILALEEKYTSKNVASIRRNLDDCFQEYFAEKFSRFSSIYPPDAKVVTDTKNLEGYIRRRLTNGALKALCEHRNRTDLALIRKVIDQQEVDFSEPVLKYFGTFGDWSDHHRVLSFSKRYGTSGLISYSKSDDKSKIIARALYTIGKNRLADLLELDADINIKRYLVLELTAKNIESFSDAYLLSEINNEDDQYRKYFSIRCAQSLSRKRILKLLDSYVGSDEKRYYNSTHWLDLGASMPRAIVKSVVNFEMQRIS